ncbi:hypothetical protein [Streptomyces sp. NPDC059080]|uniref:hypothetical protein n=1 Tax=Streptomyces sp. NPDC059080 TaxID=3346718 RepID=UPI0036B2A2E4
MSDPVLFRERGSRSRLWAIAQHHRNTTRTAKVSNFARKQAKKVFAYLATLSRGPVATTAADAATVRNTSLRDHAAPEGLIRDAQCAMANLSASMAHHVRP